METEIYDKIIYKAGGFDVIYEDNHLIAVVKPQGILSQSDISGDTDLLTLIKQDIAVRKNKPGEAFVGLVHRLDRNTGGVMVFAKTSKGASRLSDELRNKRFHKAYFALAEGRASLNNGKILYNNLLKDEKTNTVSENPKGKPCKLYAESLEVKNNRTLCLCSPITGRTHQIRAQLSLYGNPLCGDTKYGGHGVKKADGEDFLGLWSGVISVKHPTKDVMLVFCANPLDFSENNSPWWDFGKEIYGLGRQKGIERVWEKLI